MTLRELRVLSSMLNNKATSFTRPNKVLGFSVRDMDTVSALGDSLTVRLTYKKNQGKRPTIIIVRGIQPSRITM